MKNYKQFNENIKDLIIGPTEDDVWNHIKDLSPNDLLVKSSKIGFLKGVKIALSKNVDINVFNGDALVFSSYYGYTDIVKLLIDNGANVNIADDYPLKVSSEMGHYNVVKLLIDNGANVYADNNYALRYSKQEGHKKVEELIKNYMNNITNESIRGLLVGPTKQEVWENFGGLYFFETPPDTVEEFMKKLIDESIKKENSGGISFNFKDKYIININKLSYKISISTKIGKLLITLYLSDIEKYTVKSSNNTWKLRNFYERFFMKELKVYNYDILDGSIYID